MCYQEGSPVVSLCLAPLSLSSSLPLCFSPYLLPSFPPLFSICLSVSLLLSLSHFFNSLFSLVFFSIKELDCVPGSKPLLRESCYERKIKLLSWTHAKSCLMHATTIPYITRTPISYKGCTWTRYYQNFFFFYSFQRKEIE